MSDSLGPRTFRTAARLALMAAGVGAALCLLGWWLADERFYQAYLLALVVVAGLSLGCLAVLMIYHLVGGRWGYVSLRALEAGAWPLMVLPLAALPLAWGLEELYPWARPEVVARDHLIQDKAAYLNAPFFLARSAGYLALWGALAGALLALSPKNDATAEMVARRRGRLARVSAIGLVLYGLSATFAAIDWMMSLEPHWFSAVYGVTAMAGQGVVGFAIPVALLAWLTGERDVDRLFDAQRRRDLGTLLLAAVTFWMYVTFSQFLIIWSGNLPEEITWYLARSSPAWKELAAALIALHFVVPFALLLSPRVKRSAGWLGGIAALLLIMHVVEIFWLIMPPLRGNFSLHWLDFVCLVTLAGLWLTVVGWRMNRCGAVPAFPEESLEHRHGIPQHTQHAQPNG